MRRVRSGAPRAGLMAGAFLLALSMTWMAPRTAGANPLAPTFLAGDGDGHLYHVYLMPGARPEEMSWFAYGECDLPTHGGAGAVEIEMKEALWEGLVQGSIGSCLHQQFRPYVECPPISDAVRSGLDFTGLEYLNEVLYGVASSPADGPSFLATLDPTTGACGVIGLTGAGPITGLAWEPASRTMFGLTGPAPAAASTLVRIDLATGTVTSIGDTGRTLGSLEVMAFPGALRPGLLFAGGDAIDGGNLYLLDTTTGAAAIIPGVSQIPEITGLAFTGLPFGTPIQPSTWGGIKAIFR